MKALVEIKTNKKINDISIVNSGTEHYNSIVNDILKSRDFEISDVRIFEGHPENEKEYSSMQINEATYITTLVDLDKEEVENFKLHSYKIIDKAIDVISSRELDILAASEQGNEAYLYFNVG